MPDNSPSGVCQGGPLACERVALDDKTLEARKFSFTESRHRFHLNDGTGYYRQQSGNWSWVPNNG